MPLERRGNWSRPSPAFSFPKASSRMREFGVSRRLKARSAFAGSMLVLQIREDKIPSAAGGWRIRDNTGAPTCIAAAALRNRSGCPASAGHPPDHVRFRFHPVARSCFERREGRSKPRSSPARWSLIGDVETGSFRRGTKLEGNMGPIRGFRACFVSLSIFCAQYRSHTPLRPAFLGELEKQSGSSWEAVAVLGPGRPILEFQSRLAFEIC